MNEIKLSVVTPVYQNEKLVEKVVRDIYKDVILKFSDSEFIVAEDGSTDNTKLILSRLQKELGFMLITGKEKKGYMRAMKDALKACKGDLIFFLDSDAEQGPADFWKLYEKIEEGDIVIGYKEHRKPFYRVLISKVNNALLGLFFNVWHKDMNSGFRLMKKKVIDVVVDDVSIMPIAPSAELTIRAEKLGFRIKEVPTKHNFVKSIVFPVKKLPKTIFKQLLDMMRLRIMMIGYKKLKMKMRKNPR